MGSRAFSTGWWARNFLVEKLTLKTRIFCFRPCTWALRGAAPWILSRDDRRIRWINDVFRVSSPSSWSQSLVASLQSCPLPSVLQRTCGRLAEGAALHDSSWIDYSAESRGRATTASSGAFPVRESMEADRLVGDRRPWNIPETTIGSPDLPPVTDLTHWYLPPASCQGTQSRLEGHVVPVSDPEITLAGASNRPRTPLAWFDELHATEGHRWVPRGDTPWHFPDLRDGSCQSSLPGFCQPAMTAIMTGDLNGVTAAQWAHDERGCFALASSASGRAPLGSKADGRRLH